MKKLLVLFISIVAFSFSLAAEEGATPAAPAPKPAKVTLEGKAMCAKCVLGKGKKCRSVLQIKEGEETKTIPLIQTKAIKGVHKQLKAGEVSAVLTGSYVEKDDGKKIFKASKIELAEATTDAAAE